MRVLMSGGARMLLTAALLVTGACSAASLERRALHDEQTANQRAQLGDAAGAERAQRRAEAEQEAARLRAATRHGWLWHDLAMD